MIAAKCPICGKRFEVASLDEAPGFPFCSERCKLIDLGRWIDGDYAIPGPPANPNPPSAPESVEDEDD